MQEKSERKELGCAAVNGCFCTGRCRRTQEEEDEYLRQKPVFFRFTNKVNSGQWQVETKK